MSSTDHAADAENAIQGNHKYLDPQNQTSTPQACHPSIAGNEGLLVCEDVIVEDVTTSTYEDAIRIPENTWHLEQIHFKCYPPASEEEVMQALQWMQDLTIEMDFKEQDNAAEGLVDIDLTVGKQTQTTGAQPAKQPSGRQRATANKGGCLHDHFAW